MFALLDIDFDATKRSAIRAEMDILSQQGVIRLGRDGKWRLASRLAGPGLEPRDVRQPSGSAPVDQEGLIAVPANTAPQPKARARRQPDIRTESWGEQLQ
ncbi:MAG: hypothetical protein OXF07_11935 [Rhodobacter sp.]|nr:hypothetical protein [Rhodobacter sp.]